MNNKHQVHNLIILDESGSMLSIKQEIIEAFNAIVTTMKKLAESFPEQEHLISMVTFNSLETKTYLNMSPLASLDVISGRNYCPQSSTPLYDAMGFSIGRLRNETAKSGKHNVLVSVLTDGLENASREYSGPAIRSLVDELKRSGNWTFTYTGADHDVEKAAMDVSIPNAIRFQKSKAGIDNFLRQELHGRKIYMQKVMKGEDVSLNYFDANGKK
jgi:hypothetical protein